MIKNKCVSVSYCTRNYYPRYKFNIQSYIIQSPYQIYRKGKPNRSSDHLFSRIIIYTCNNYRKWFKKIFMRQGRLLFSKHMLIRWNGVWKGIDDLIQSVWTRNTAVTQCCVIHCVATFKNTTAHALLIGRRIRRDVQSATTLQSEC